MRSVSMRVVARPFGSTFPRLAIVLLLGCGGGGGPGSTDRIPPSAVGMIPFPDAAGVPLDQTITVLFGEPVDCGRVGASSLVVVACDSAEPAPGTVSCSGNTIGFVPTALWEKRCRYQVSVRGISDLVGNVQTPEIDFAFTTGIDRPTFLCGESPSDGQTDVGADTTVSLCGVDLDPGTITADAFNLACGGAPVVGVLSFVGHGGTSLVTFTPAGPLADGVECTATATSRIRTTAGASWPRDFSWTFTTRAMVGTLETPDLAQQDVADPHIALDASGDLMAVWLQRTGEGASGFYTEVWEVVAARRTAGGTWSAPMSIADADAGISALRVGCGAAGSCVALWGKYGPPLIQSWFSVPTRIFANQYDPASGWGSPIAIDTGDDPKNLPELAVASDGSAVAVWISDTDGLVANRFAPGAGWSGPYVIETASGRPDASSVAVNAAGQAVAVWLASGVGVLSSWYVPTAGWSAATLLESSAEFLSQPAVALDRSGTAVAVWQQGSGLWVCRGTEASWGSAIQIALGGPGRVRVDDAGNAIVVSDELIRYKASVGWGIAMSLPEHIPGVYSGTNVAMTGSGEVAITWSDVGPLGSGSRYVYIFLARLSATGWQPPVTVGGLGSGASGPVPDIAMIEGRTAVAFVQGGHVRVNVLP